MDLELQLRQTLQRQHKADSTADAYWRWCEKFILFARAKRGNWVHPRELGERHVEIFLRHLAVNEQVSATTQNQAFSALLYLYKHVIRKPLENVSALRAKKGDRIRDVLDESEVVALFARLHGVNLLVAKMQYASGFRIGEVGDLRIKDLDFNRKQITVRRGKGDNDRIVPFPESIHDDVRRQIASVEVLHRFDLQDGLNGVSLPKAWGRKSPSSRMDFNWWYLFPAADYSRCPKTRGWYRHHRDMGNVGRAITRASKLAKIPKRITSHCLRHSFATHSLESGTPVHYVQQILGHKSIETTQRYLHCMKSAATSVKSPIDLLGN